MGVRSDDGETSKEARRSGQVYLAVACALLFGGTTTWMWLVARAWDGPPTPDWVDLAGSAAFLLGLLVAVGSIAEFRRAKRLRTAGR